MNGKSVVGFAAGVMVVVAACSSTSSSGGTPALTCCVNHNNHVCPDQAALEKCTGTATTPQDPSECTASNYGCGYGSTCGRTGYPCAVDRDCCTGLGCYSTRAGHPGSCQ
jgi:hypothetical protein